MAAPHGSRTMQRCYPLDAKRSARFFPDSIVMTAFCAPPDGRHRVNRVTALARARQPTSVRVQPSRRPSTVIVAYVGCESICDHTGRPFVTTGGWWLRWRVGWVIVGVLGSRRRRAASTTTSVTAGASDRCDGSSRRRQHPASPPRACANHAHAADRQSLHTYRPTPPSASAMIATSRESSRRSTFAFGAVGKRERCVADDRVLGALQSR